jgi:hypothetical protein
MKHDEIVKAIHHIYPDGAKFTIRDTEIEWLDSDKTQPTQEELQVAYTAYEVKLESDAEQAEIAKAAAQAKLAALGLTSDDLKALGL